MCSSSFTYAQNVTRPDQVLAEYKQDSQASIFLLNTNEYALIGYATYILGSYEVKGNKITFTPLKANTPFTILGRENKSLKEEIKLTFEGQYQYSAIQIQLDEGSVMEIFPEDFEGGKPFYTITIKERLKKISLILPESRHHILPTNAYSFTFDPSSNDFLFFLHEPKEEEIPFSGFLEQEKERSILKTSWGDFIKNEEKTDDESIEMIYTYKDLYEKQLKDTVFYFNDQLKQANGHSEYWEGRSSLNLKQYIFDEAANKWIRKDRFQKDQSYLDAKAENYHDESILLEYKRIEGLKNENKKWKKGKGNESLFRN